MKFHAIGIFSGRIRVSTKELRRIVNRFKHWSAIQRTTIPSEKEMETNLISFDKRYPISSGKGERG